MKIRTRFAPSPTGYLHIGSVWAALLARMYARHHQGQFILRIEDTDTRRTVPGAMENLMEGLRWFDIDWDEGPEVGGEFGPYIQTERAELYQEYAYWLIGHGHAYKCFTTPEELAEMREQGVRGGYDRRYRDYPAEKVAELESQGKPYVIRLRMPLTGETIVPDLLRGDVVFQNDQFTDYVLLKSNGLPTYHLAVVIDDHFMEISHITRGVEWLNTAPIHVNLYKAFGWQMPVLVHLPVILNPSGKGKLSKRRQAFEDSGEKVLVRADEYMEAGYLPQAAVNFLANVGWTFGDDREKFTIEEAIARFDLVDVSPVPMKLPYSKLDWLNGLYIQEMDTLELAQAIKPFLEAEGWEVTMDALLLVMPAMKTRMKTLPDAIPFLRFLFVEMPLRETAATLTHKHLPTPAAKAAFAETRDFVAIVEPFDVQVLGAGIAEIGARHTLNEKPGPFLGKLRLGITGQKVSPPVYESMVALGRERTLARLDEIISVFRNP
ncbi:MAG: glutamate--tRNA ligase [Chloroflexi bacterium]|nr:glutamate--tRNA ligase [Chloroflexota bacterium]